MADQPRMNYTRQKVVQWRPNGEIYAVRYIAHRPGFAIELYMSHLPHIDGIDRAEWGGGHVDVEGVGPMWLTESPGGVEIHSRTRPRWEPEDKPAHHAACSVLSGPCWYDGSSTAASDFRRFWQGDDESAWALVEYWAAREEADREEATDA